MARGAPKIKHITVRIIPDATTRILEMRRGTVNFEVNAIPFENVAEFREEPRLYRGERAPARSINISPQHEGPGAGETAGAPGHRHAIDRERIIRDIQRGYAQKTETMLADGHWARATNLPTSNYDPAKSEQLLARPDIRTPTISSSRRRRMPRRPRARCAAMMKQAGFNVSIQSNEMSTFSRTSAKEISSSTHCPGTASPIPISIPDLLLEEHSAERPEPGYYATAPRRLADPGHSTSTAQNERNLRRGPEDRPTDLPTSPLHAIERGQHAQERDRLSAVPGRFYLSIRRWRWK